MLVCLVGRLVVVRVQELVRFYFLISGDKWVLGSCFYFFFFKVKGLGDYWGYKFVLEREMGLRRYVLLEDGGSLRLSL